MLTFGRIPHWFVWRVKNDAYSTPNAHIPNKVLPQLWDLTPI